MNDQAKWMELNEKHLTATVKWIRLRLQQLVPPPKPAPLTERKGCNWFRRSSQATVPIEMPKIKKPKNKEIERAYQEMVELEKNEPPPALILLAGYLGLSVFDCRVLALCAALEMDTRIAHLCARAQDDLSRSYPTFALAFALFDDPDWNVLSPHGPLRHWRLIEINQAAAQPLTSAALRADERIVNYLKGLNYLDDRLTSLVDPVEIRSGNGPLPPSQQLIVDKIVHHLTSSNGDGRLPVVELLGYDSTSKRLIAGEVAFLLKLKLQTTDLKTLPSQTGDFDTFTRLWQRESNLLPLALYIDLNGTGEAENIHLRRFLKHFSGVIFIDRENPGTDAGGHRISFEIDKPTPEEQEALWIEALNGNANQMSARLAEQFSFSQHEIQRLAGAVMREHSNNGAELDDTLWQACRVVSRVGMGDLAQRIDAKATWKQIVLPPEQKEQLHQITDQVYQRNRVYEEWGFRDIMNRGMGISALFTGESGTGKTMAAEVIANDLKLDLYRIDLSAVVNKYIGETEKNLRKLFDAAEDSGAILFFDEADALFGKRSEVKDSHDRYANIEINYLLQKMEAYRGLAILASNMKSALDKAFVRRLRFIVNFPFPDATARKKIWENVFPDETPGKKALDYQFLAKHPLTGGSIHNIALNAAFLAAQDGGSVTMPLLLKAARTEFKKLERPMKESDFQWQGHIEVAK